MTLEWTTIGVPLGLGVDTKTNEKLLQPPNCADLSDAVFPASGASGYETRKGYDRIVTDTSISSIDALGTVENELLVAGNDKLYSVSELTNNVDLISKGNLLAVSVTQETLDTQAVNQTLGQVITHGGLQVHAWLDSGTSTVQYTVADAVTGARISTDNSLADSTNPKLAKTTNSILVFYYNSSALSLRCTVIPIYAPGSTSDVEVFAAMDSDGLFDCIETDSSLQTVYVVLKDDDTADGLTALLVDESGSVTDSSTVVGTYAATALAISTTATSFTILATDGTTCDSYHSATYPSSLRTTAWTTTPHSKANVINLAYVAVNDSTIADGDEQHYVWFETAGASPQFNYVELSIGNGIEDLDLASSNSTFRQCSIASCAFLDGSTPYVHFGFDSTLQRQYLLVNSAGEVQAKCCVAEGAGNVTPHLPRVIDFTWAPVFREHLDIDLPEIDDVETVSSVYAQYGLKKVTYDLSYRPVFVEYGAAAYIQSGVLWQYDGNQLVEQGFHIYPELENVTAPAEGTGGSLTQLASYSYRVYYEWINARGERQRSTTAALVTHQLTGANDDITLTIPTLTHTKKGTDVAIVVYRSEGDPNLVAGAPMYRVSSPDPSATGDNGYVANDPTSDTVTFTDNFSDATLLTKELDYLNTGELDHTAAHVGSIIGEAKNRVWVAGFEKGNRCQYSKTNVRGRDQLEFNDTLVVDVPEDGGDVTAYGALNFHVVVFKETSCYAFSGEGKNNVGAGFFNLPQVVSLDVGCIEPRSIVNIPEGIMFKSNKGIWRLGHNLDMKYVGANVEAYNDQDITAATLIPSENHVVFLTSSGRALVFNYLIGQWTTWTNHAGSSAVIWNGSYTYARTDGRIYRQGDNYSDDGTHYAMKIVTAPIGIKGVQGKQKIRHIRLLGEYYSPHTLRVGLRFNHHPGVTDTGTWDPSDGITVSLYGAGAYGDGAYGGDGSPVYQARFNMPRQKCQTVQFVIDSTNTGGAGRAVSIQAIQIEVGAKTGTGELSVNSSFSASGGSTE